MAATWLDRAIGVLSPGLMAARIEARFRVAALTQATALYTGATQSHRVSARPASNASANAEIRGSLSRLRARHRDLVRNNPYAARAVSARVANTVGSGIAPSVVTDRPTHKRRVTDLVEEHLLKTAIDFDGRTNLYGLQAMAERSRSESGEVLLIRTVPDSATMARLGLRVPLQIRVLEADHIDTAKHGPVAGGGWDLMGIRYDATGHRRGYWLFDAHPGSADADGRSTLGMSRLVPAEDVIHYFHVLRPGQVRGVPDGTPVIVTMGDLDEYEDARLMREKIAACFVAFWHRAEGDAPTNMAQGARRAQQAAGPVPVMDLAPGLIQELPEGSQITFGEPPATTGHAEYVKATVRRIAIGYDLSYEEVAGDLEDVSFLSGRLGEIHLARRVEQWQWHHHVPVVCDGIARWFADAATVPLGRAIPFRLEWTAPRRALLSPKDEVPAMRDAVRAGFVSRAEQIRTLGYDPETVDAEQAADNARADGLQLRHDSDGRRPRQGPSQTITDQPQGDA